MFQEMTNNKDSLGNKLTYNYEAKDNKIHVPVYPNSEWVQIGMNPYKHSYFYDKKTMQPILSADEVIQVGPLVLARNVVRGKASDFAFEEGGVVDMRKGGRVKRKV